MGRHSKAGITCLHWYQSLWTYLLFLCISLLQRSKFCNTTGPTMCNGCCDIRESNCGSFLDIFLFILCCVYIYLHACIYIQIIYTSMHVYSTTVYLFYKHTHSSHIRNLREIILQEHYICFPHGKPKLVLGYSLWYSQLPSVPQNKYSLTFLWSDWDLSFSSWQHLFHYLDFTA